VGGPHQRLQIRGYEIFAAYWPYYDEDAPDGGIARLFRDIRKYVVSRSAEVDTGWQDSVLLRDIADVKRLREDDGPSLVTQGSTELVHDLVDAISMFIVPVVLGGGKMLFAGGSMPHSCADPVAGLEHGPRDRALRARR
jgi:dihydrofolate reductase